MAAKKTNRRKAEPVPVSEAPNYIASDLDSTDFIRMGRDGPGEYHVRLDRYRAEVEMTELDREEFAAQVREAVQRALKPTALETEARKAASAGIDRLAAKLAGSGLSSVELVREMRGDI